MMLKSKDDFCRDRVEAFMAKFDMKIIRDKRRMDARKRAFIHDKAFFDVIEFKKTTME